MGGFVTVFIRFSVYPDELFQAEIYVLDIEPLQVKTVRVKPIANFFVFFALALFEDLCKIFKSSGSADILNNAKALTFKHAGQQCQRDLLFFAFFKGQVDLPAVTIVIFENSFPAGTICRSFTIVNAARPCLTFPLIFIG